jgi:outer membrane protein assembly factor BamB
VNATPIVVGHRVYAGDSTGLFHAITDKRAPVWAAQLPNNILSSALITDRFAFVGTGRGTLFALNLADGSVAWQVRPNPHAVASIQRLRHQLHNGVDWPDLFVDPANFRPPPTSGSVFALSPGLSRELWRFETPGSPFLSGVAVAAGVVYAVSSRPGTLYALNAFSGEKLAEVALGPTVSGPSVSRGHVYVGTGNLLISSLPTAAQGTITALGL